MLPDSNSDGRWSFASTADASLEEAADSESAVPAVAAANDSGSGESDGPRSPRAAAHTHTIWQNDYFILTDNRHFPNLKMRIRIRWLGPAHLGSALSSKTLMPINFGDSRDEPHQGILVLKDGSRDCPLPRATRAHSAAQFTSWPGKGYFLRGSRSATSSFYRRPRGPISTRDPRSGRSSRASDPCGRSSG